MISFGTPTITGELAPIPAQPTPNYDPPIAASLEAFWGEALIGTMSRIDWFDTSAGEFSHSTYGFTSCSGKTVLAASDRDELIALVVEKLTKCDNQPAVQACATVTAADVPY